MLEYFAHVFKFLKFFYIVSKNLKKQKAFVAHELMPIVNAALANNDGTIKAADIRKLKVYATTIPAMLGEAFCVLRSREMSDDEKLSLTFLGSITGMFDDLFDNQNLSPQYIKTLLNNPLQAQANNSFEYLLVNLYQQGIQRSKKESVIKQYAHEVYLAQVDSYKQKSESLGVEQLKQIIFRKGGVSMPLYRCAFDGDISKDEYDLLYALGTIGQFENDIFDVYKDFHEGIQTLVSIATNMSTLKADYEKLILHIFKLIEATHFPLQNQQKFKMYVSLIVCRGLVGLHNLEYLASTTDGIFKINEYPRRTLICDMESPLNLLKLLHYAAIYAKK